MSDNVLDPDGIVWNETVDVILAMCATMPTNEAECVSRVQDIGLLARRLLTDATTASTETINEWTRRLHHVPTNIGIHPEFSNESQRIIDGIRNSVERYIDFQLPGIARDNIPMPDSGITIDLGEGIDPSMIILED